MAESCLRIKRAAAGVQFKQMAEEYSGNKLYGLSEPEFASCHKKLAEGGEACWYSSVFYLLTG